MSKFWKVIKWIIIVVIGFFVIDAAVVLFFSFYRPPLQKADAIVILGAAINTPELYNRSLEGLNLYNKGYASQIVLSGGQDFAKAPTEASYMEKVIKSNSSSTVPVILEDQSHSTYENIVNTKNKIGTGKKIIIVSDSYHLARGVLIAEREGFHVISWSAPYAYYYNKSQLFYYYFREISAMVDYIPKFIKG